MSSKMKLIIIYIVGLIISAVGLLKFFTIKDVHGIIYTIIIAFVL